MPRLLSLSRAARLVGTTRGKLQKRVQDGEITSFEGKVNLTELSQLYPQAIIEDTAMLDRVEEIIERSRHKARNRLPLPSDKQSLLARASVLADELALAKLDLSNFAFLIHKLKTKLHTLSANSGPEAKDILQQLSRWLESELPKTSELVSPSHQLLVQDTMLRLMTAQVQLLPSQHEYLVEGTNTLLEAGLSAGFALNYGCSNGNCGKCKARLLSGQVSKTRPHDYSFTEAEKNRNYILMCCNTALTDIVIEADEAGNTNDIPVQDITAKVKKIEPADDTVQILNLKTPRTKRLRFLAGQQATLHLNNALSKTLPIASCPCDDMNIQLHISNSDGDEFSRVVFNQLKQGDEIRIEGPLGDFILDDDATNPLILLAMDTGFAPIKSLAEHALTLAHTEHVYLYWFTSGNHTHYMQNQCRAWADAFDSLQYAGLTIPQGLESDAGKREFSGQLARLGSEQAGLANSHVYLAGNKYFIEEGKKYFKALSLPRVMYQQVD